jgi:hypothetical protein
VVEIDEEGLYRVDATRGQGLEEGLLLVGILEDRLEGLGALDEIFTRDGSQIMQFLCGEFPELSNEAPRDKLRSIL